jgi:hypothetical protein
LSRAALVLTLALTIAGCGGPASSSRLSAEPHLKAIRKQPARTGTAPDGETRSEPALSKFARGVQVACRHLGRLPSAGYAETGADQVRVLEKELSRFPRFRRELLELRLPKGHDTESRTHLAFLGKTLRTYEHYLTSVIALDQRIVSDVKIRHQSTSLAIGMSAHDENAQQRISLALALDEFAGPSCLDRTSSE